MTIRHLLFTGALALPTFMMPARQDTVRVSAAAVVAAEATTIAEVPPAPWAAEDPADSLYRAGQKAITEGNFRRAAAIFAEIGKKYPRSEYAEDSPYWRAFALYKVGGEDELRDALDELENQKRRFPKARTIADANTLAVRIRGALAKKGDLASAEQVTTAATRRTNCGDMEMRIEAINALQQMDAQNAMPILKEVLGSREACTVEMRKKAVFILSQKRSSETEALLIDVIRNDPSRDVKETAVFWMGQVHSEAAAAALENIATSSADIDLRSKAVFALGQQNSSRGSAIVRRLAESSDTPRSVREQAIFQLGQRQSSDNAEFLRSLFGRLGKGDGSDNLRKNVLFSLSQMHCCGNARWLLDIALERSESDDVRGHALWTAGQAGIPGSDLVAMYDRLSDAPLKEKLIWVLSESNSRVASDKLVEIAQKDPDREMRKKAIFWLGQKNDPRIRQILLDIIRGD